MKGSLSVLVESCGGSSRRVGWGDIGWDIAVGGWGWWVGLEYSRGSDITSSSVVEGQTTISCHTPSWTCGKEDRSNDVIINFHECM